MGDMCRSEVRSIRWWVVGAGEGYGVNGGGWYVHE